MWDTREEIMADISINEYIGSAKTHVTEQVLNFIALKYEDALQLIRKHEFSKGNDYYPKNDEISVNFCKFRGLAKVKIAISISSENANEIASEISHGSEQNTENNTNGTDNTDNTNSTCMTTVHYTKYNTWSFVAGTVKLDLPNTIDCYNCVVRYGNDSSIGYFIIPKN